MDRGCCCGDSGLASTQGHGGRGGRGRVGQVADCMRVYVSHSPHVSHMSSLLIDIRGASSSFRINAYLNNYFGMR